MPYTPPWLTPPNYSAIMESGAQLGLSRQQMQQQADEHAATLALQRDEMNQRNALLGQATQVKQRDFMAGLQLRQQQQQQAKQNAMLALAEKNRRDELEAVSKAQGLDVRQQIAGGQLGLGQQREGDLQDYREQLGSQFKDKLNQQQEEFAQREARLGASAELRVAQEQAKNVAKMASFGQASKADVAAANARVQELATATPAAALTPQPAAPNPLEAFDAETMKMQKELRSKPHTLDDTMALVSSRSDARQKVASAPAAEADSTEPAAGVFSIANELEFAKQIIKKGAPISKVAERYKLRTGKTFPAQLQ